MAQAAGMGTAWDSLPVNNGQSAARSVNKPPNRSFVVSGKASPLFSFPRHRYSFSLLPLLRRLAILPGERGGK
jgi:hypothetical protein